jgi:winged helix-turn-helix protein
VDTLVATRSGAYGPERGNMTTNELDQQRSEAFAERMLGVINDGAIALMTSIGQRTGLFDAMAGCPPPRAKG